jgi:transcriptional regulator with XRE-family HTH domain
MDLMSRGIVYTVPIEGVLKRHGVSAEQFAAAAGVGMQTYRCYRRGVRSPSIDVALAAERELRIPRHELRPDIWPPPRLTKASRCRSAA